MHDVTIKDIIIGSRKPLAAICGPCVIEDESHCMRAAEALKKIYGSAKMPFLFKSSYDKANRTSVTSFRGPGLDEGLRILAKVSKELELPIVTDVHTPEQARAAGEVCDMIQIPAFLCRQTDLLVAAGKTGKPIAVKKGQFLAPGDMKNVINKILSTGNEQILLMDRGTSFGYNTLVSDMRAIPIMQGLGFPVCFDATHSVQQPSALGGTSGGQREFIPTLAKAAVAAGCNCVFMEAHNCPAEAKCDAAAVIDFRDLPRLLKTLSDIHAVVNGS